MKIGFQARTLMITEKYWQKLQDKADCWWAVTQEEFYDILRERGYEKIIFHKERRVLQTEDETRSPFSPVVPGESENIVAAEMDPDIWIAESLHKLNYVPKKAPWIQIFHSMPLKKHFFYHTVNDYDLMLLPGEYHKEEMIKRLKLRDDDARLKVVGWPRIDDFVNNVYDRDTVLNECGLDPKRKTVSYIPTWGMGLARQSMFTRWFDRDHDIFEQLCRAMKERELNFVVKLHCLAHRAEDPKMMAIADKYGVLWETKEMACTQSDPNPLLSATDILISDLSGAITDFLVLDRPVIYIDPDERLDAWQLSDMPKTFRAGHVVETFEQLVEALDDSLNNPERFSKKRKTLVQKLFYKPDGKAIDRAVDEILKFVESKQPVCKV